MQNLKTWRCGRCGLAIDLPDPETEHDLFVAAMNRIREHRWAHLVTAFEDGSDAALDRLCEGEPATPSPPQERYADGGQSAFALNQLGNLSNTASDPPVDSDDVTPVLEGISELLRADLPRARRLWYPINEDGSFNREED